MCKYQIFDVCFSNDCFRNKNAAIKNQGNTVLYI